MSESIAKKIYDFGNFHLADRKAIGRFVAEYDLTFAHKNLFGKSYASYAVALAQFGSIFLHLANLLKNILLLLGTLLLAFLAAFSDWSIARQLGFTAFTRCLTIGLNIANTLFALTSFFVNSAVSGFSKASNIGGKTTVARFSNADEGNDATPSSESDDNHSDLSRRFLTKVIDDVTGFFKAPSNHYMSRVKQNETSQDIFKPLFGTR